MKGNDIRESYLSFFENKKDHLRLKSFSLIPKDADRRRNGTIKTVFHRQG